ncbi:methyl-accepting chemotaxis protein [Gallaecimonas xiamenensis]|uniref:Methyl-accepting chemotaxis protein n=1 Tax=Gallaecimonas xiamenensis 3-C-1 TaxID=745411 RepID=K2KKI0_9GAMM|nr:methyl-accepting chemotaxis protein [Gallaecimonas xiamenensis]EKE77910.1 methyl-accepting chemotaxis protein [Gallaecimonas xiamenensis 3-C-1]
MKEKSLAFKLFLTTGLLLLISIGVLTLVVAGFLDTAANKVRSESTRQVEEELMRRLEAQAGQSGEQMAAFINEAYRVPLSLAGLLKGSIESAEPLARQQVADMDRAILAANPGMSSVYSQFEANAYDGQDANFKSGFEHSVAGVGTLEVYFTRDQQGNISQQAVEDADEKHVATVGANGLREAEWYLCAMDNKKPCLMEPYLYEISPGYSELMTSLTVPVLAQGRFRGVVGVDVNLPVFQKKVKALSASLYDGQAKVMLLSKLGLLVGASHHEDKLAQSLKTVMPDMAAQILGMQGQDRLETDQSLFVSYPVTIPASGQTWKLVIEVPKALALADVNAMNKSIDQDFQQLVLSQMGIGVLVVAVGLVVMVFLVRTITRPLNLFNSRMDNLNSAEGDLTREVDIDTHQELISLAGGFNRFLGKLRGMIVHLKGISLEVGSQAEGSARIATETRQLVARQHAEIESVVTAMNEMSAAATEVAQFAAQAASEANQANDAVQGSRRTLETAVQDVQGLADDMSTAATAVNQVAARSSDINAILDVIRNIAEQTNLLALNAAIEAARAGDQGRGFAVVADEVRALAAKTRTSTDEIAGVINSLNKEVTATVSVIDQGVERASSTVEQTHSAFNDLTEVVRLIDTINDHVTQMATAAEEQSSVSDEINRNITGIGEAASELATLAQRAEHSGQQLHSLVRDLDGELGKLKT